MGVSRKNTTGRKIVTLLSCTALVSVEMMRVMPAARAQVVADPSAPLGNRPSITTNSAGRPQVNITAPSAGVSRNSFSDFNVTPDGLILNNSVTGASTSLGVVSANPNLAISGSATVILNEVTSSNASSLQGKTVVAGPQADVIIANPNGLTCDGCSFEGSGTATLSTGSAIVDPATGNVSLSVAGGTALIGRGGLSSGGDVNVIGRHVVMDGPIVSSGDATVSGGAQFFDPQTGVARSAPTIAAPNSIYAVDGTAFGAMDAGRIRIFGNEDGLGVRSAGALKAQDGLEVQSSGALEIGDADAGAGDAQFSAGGRAEFVGDVTAGGDVVVDAKSIGVSPDATIRATRNVAMTASGAITNFGVIDGDAVSIATDGAFENRGFVFGRDDVIVTAEETIGNIRDREAFFESASAQDVQRYAAAFERLAQQYEDEGHALASYYRDLADKSQFAVFKHEALTAGASIGGVDVTLIARGDVVNEAGAVAAARDLWIQSLEGSVYNLFQDARAVVGECDAEGYDCGYDHSFTAGELLAGRDLLVEGAEHVVIAGSDVAAGRDVELVALAQDVAILNPRASTNVVSQITSQRWVASGKSGHYVTTTDFETQRDFAHRPSRVTASSGDIFISAGRDLIGEAASLSAGGDLYALAGGDILLQSTTAQDSFTNANGSTSFLDFLTGYSTVAARDVILSGENVAIEGVRVFASGDIDIEARSGDLSIDAIQQNIGQAEDESIDLAAEIDKLSNLDLGADFFAQVVPEEIVTEVTETFVQTGSGKFGAIGHWRTTEREGWVDPQTGLVRYDFDNRPSLEVQAQKDRAKAFVNGADLLLAVDHLRRAQPDGDLPIDNLFAAIESVALQGSDAFDGDDASVWSIYGTGVQGFESLARSLSQRGDLARLGETEIAYEPSQAFFDESQRDFVLHELAAALPDFEDAILKAEGGLALSAGGELILAGGAQALIDGDAALRGEQVAILSIDDSGVTAGATLEEIAANAGDESFAGRAWDPELNAAGALEAITEIDVDPVRLTTGGDLTVTATFDFENYGGRLNAGGDLDLQIGGNLIHSSLSENYTLAGADGCVGLACGKDGVRFRIAELTAGGSAVIDAGGDIWNRGAQIVSDGAMYLRAGGDLNNTALSDKFVIVDYSHSWTSGKWWRKKRHYVRRFEETPVIAPGVIEAENGFSNVFTGGDLVIDGSYLASGGDLSVTVGGDAFIQARSVEVANVNYYQRKGSFLGFSVSKGVNSAEWNQFDTVYGTIQGQGDVTLTAGGNLIARGADVAAGQGLDIEVGGDILIEPLELATYERIEVRSSGIFSDSRYSTNRQKLEIDRSTLAAGADLGLTSETGDITIKAGSLSAGGDLTIEALQGQIALLAGVEKELFEKEHYSANVAWFTNVQEGFYREDPVHTHLLAGGKLELRAANGLIVEYRGDESLEESIQKLGQVPELAWMLELRTRTDVEWRAIEPVFEEWRDKQEGLTPAGAAIIALAVAVAAGPAGSYISGQVAGAIGGAAGNIAGAAVSAGFKSIVTKATLSLVNNKGDIGAALEELGSSQNLKSIATAMVTAGVLTGLGEIAAAQELPFLNPENAEAANEANNVAGGAASAAEVIEGIGQEILDQAVQNVVSASISLAIEGGDAEDLFLAAGLNAVVSSIGAYAAGEIGAAYDNGAGDLSYAARLIAHTALGCGIGAATDGAEGCAGGAAGAFAGTLTADLYDSFVTDVEAIVATKAAALGRPLTESELYEIKEFAEKWGALGVDVSRLAGGLSALSVGSDPTIGASSAGNVAEHNVLPLVYFVVQGALLAWTAYELYNTTLQVAEVIDDYDNGRITDDVLQQKLIDAGLGALFDVTAGKVMKGVDAIKIAKNALEKAGVSAADLQSALVKARKRSCSFHGDTLVLAKRGYVPIRDIRAGDHKVWARHELTGRMGWRPVLAQYSNPYEETVHVAIRDGETGAVQVIRSNRIHPFFAVRDAGRASLYTRASAISAPPSSEGHRYAGAIEGGAWIDAQHLQKGDRLLNADESWAEVVSVSVQSQQLTAYNLTVDHAHTYFVSGAAGAEPVWVHNDCISGKTRLENGREIDVSMTQSRGQHVLDGEIEFDERGRPIGSTGGHSTNSGNVKTVGEVEVGHAGVRRAVVEIDGTQKTNNGGVSTLFPEGWSDAKILQEFRDGLANSVTSRGPGGQYRVVTPSGVTIQFTRDTRTGEIGTFFPVFE